MSSGSPLVINAAQNPARIANMIANRPTMLVDETVDAVREVCKTLLRNGQRAALVSAAQAAGMGTARAVILQTVNASKWVH